MRVAEVIGSAADLGPVHQFRSCRQRCIDHQVEVHCCGFARFQAAARQITRGNRQGGLCFAVRIQRPSRVQACGEAHTGRDIIGQQDIVRRDRSLVEDGDGVMNRIARFDSCALVIAQFFHQCKVEDLGHQGRLVVVVFVFALVAVAVDVVINGISIVICRIRGGVVVHLRIAVVIRETADLRPVDDLNVGRQR